ncbi:YceI family protein [Halobacteriovorax sp. HLS]|uniref:YceI family protein n=1 Tax=Halobacteriovorax sp. HLS TaxID=2234000 RepID=UPI000FDBE2D9|nr:YceI family protein [Halobacteriovorax sp. HLS]
MKQSFLVKIVLFLVFSFSSMAASKGVIVDVNLSPAGSFQIKGKLKGSVTQKGDKLISNSLYASVQKFKTGMDLRDDHTKKKLEYKKYPKVEILKAAGKDGKGQAIIQIRSIKKKVSFTYKKLNSKYIQAVFNLSLKDFNFEGINYMGVGVKDIVKVTATVPVK